MFIDVNEYQKKILDIIGSNELDKIIASSVYADNHEFRMAILYGMTIASMYTSQCTQYIFDVTKSDACLNVKQLKPNHTYCSEKDICTKEECPEFNQKINMCSKKNKMDYT